MDDKALLNQHADLALLLDFYGNLLTEKLQVVLQLAVNEDWSLSEISEEVGVTRQAVHDRIQRGARALLQFERQLGLVARWKEEKTAWEALRQLLESGNLEEAQRCVQEFLDQWDQ